jgi:hypothetical protein
MKEYQIRPVTRYIVTEFEEGKGSRVVKEYPDRRTAWIAADAMANATDGLAVFKEPTPTEITTDRVQMDLRDGADHRTVPSSDGLKTLEESLPAHPPRETR